jgi:hypothetical protein
MITLYIYPRQTGKTQKLIEAFALNHELKIIKDYKE